MRFFLSSCSARTLSFLGAWCLFYCLIFAPAPLAAQTVAPPVAPVVVNDKPAELKKRPPAPNDIAAPVPTRADMLRGAYGPYRANNDLLYYHLDIRVDPAAKTIAGKNTIRFRMVQDGTRIQIDLLDTLSVDKILFGDVALKYTRDTGAVLIDFPETLRAGKNVKVLVATPESSEWQELPVNTAAGLEVGLIEMIRPSWNIRGAQ